jgi:hypothetical protein
MDGLRHATVRARGAEMGLCSATLTLAWLATYINPD